MQDGALETTNNMQADNDPVIEAQSREEPDQEPVWMLVFPGPRLFHWRKVIPNSITAMATIVGLSSIYLGMIGDFKNGVVVTILAAMLDGLDGPVARALHGTSRFGAELDSLSDYVNFGVGPAVLMYLWTLREFGIVGWVIALFYTVMMGCRLARFNAGVDFNASPATRNFFMGVPAPLGALLAMLPIAATVQFPQLEPLLRDPRKIAPYIVFVAFTLVSRLPTFSSKMLSKEFFKSLNTVQSIIAGAIILGSVFSVFVYPWMFLLSFGALYICSFPLSFASFANKIKNAQQSEKKSM